MLTTAVARRTTPRRHARCSGQDGRERAGPECVDELFGAGIEPPREHMHVVPAGDMDDEGVETRPALGLENSCRRDGVKRVGPEAVHGFRGEGDQAARSQDLRGPGDILIG